MKPPGFFERIDDAINPIVVKELRQAVHSRFVVAVLLLFLLIQLVFLGCYLTFAGIGGRLDQIDYQAGRDVFTWLQVILLATCMLFLPAYTGARLAAERSEVNTDLLFITTLQPRKIISGKLASSVLIAVLIFSACAPFMAFTYFLRGIDLPSIFLVVLIDFLVVIGSVHLMVLLAVVPTNRVLKAFLGVLGFAILMFIFVMTLTGTISMVQMGAVPDLGDREFWSYAGPGLIAFAGLCGLIYTWSVALISAPSANRTLPMRVFMLAYTLVSAALFGYICVATNHDEPAQMWMLIIGFLIFFALLIAINERERWSPRVARTIPRSWLLRPFAFVLYSGAAGGLLFAGVLMAIQTAGYLLFQAYYPMVATPRWTSLADAFYRVLGIVLLYIYCYGMTAVLLRNWLFRNIPANLTWVLFLLLMGLGSLLPWLVSVLTLLGTWNYMEHYVYLFGNPGAAAFELGERGLAAPSAQNFLMFALVWAATVTVLNLPWLFRQVRAFRPYDASGATVVPVPADSSSSVTLPVSR